MAANQQRKDERTSLEGKQGELAAWLENQDQAAETATALPAKISSFIEDFENLETRRAKALLQPILKAMHVYFGGRLEIIPSHCDPTINLYNNYHVHRNGFVVAVWPITGRGRTD